MLGQMQRQRLRPETLRGVVASSKVSNAAFTRQMHGLLGYLARQIGIDAQRDSLFEIPLRSAGTPGQASDRPRRVTDHQGRPAQSPSQCSR